VAITLQQHKKLNVLRLKGVIDISSATELKEHLLTAQGLGKEVRVSIKDATDLDVTAVQLLWAAERKAKGAGVGFYLAGPAPKEMVAALSEAGLQQFLMDEFKVPVKAE
jgi:anti-anti-sigma regulatory factor